MGDWADLKAVPKWLLINNQVKFRWLCQLHTHTITCKYRCNKSAEDSMLQNDFQWLFPFLHIKKTLSGFSWELSHRAQHMYTVPPFQLHQFFTFLPNGILWQYQGLWISIMLLNALVSLATYQLFSWSLVWDVIEFAQEKHNTSINITNLNICTNIIINGYHIMCYILKYISPIDVGICYDV